MHVLPGVYTSDMSARRRKTSGRRLLCDDRSEAETLERKFKTASNPVKKGGLDLFLLKNIIRQYSQIDEDKVLISI